MLLFIGFICGSWKILGFTIQERHISESYLKKMPTMPTPSPRRTRCGSCGEKFSIGWGLRNHHQSSACSPSALDEGGIEGETPEITVSSYMEDLAVKGTLDPYFLNKYASCESHCVRVCAFPTMHWGRIWLIQKTCSNVPRLHEVHWGQGSPFTQNRWRMLAFGWKGNILVCHCHILVCFCNSTLTSLYEMWHCGM